MKIHFSWVNFVLFFCLNLCILTATPAHSELTQKECVILLHGLLRSSSSMDGVKSKFEDLGFYVANIDYVSRKRDLPEIAKKAIDEGLKKCRDQKATKVNFVTHSMGGILVRFYQKEYGIPELKRVVMLAPPNKGSHVVDKLKGLSIFSYINGPSGVRLGTGEKDMPKLLGPVSFELGVIAGTRSINLILSLFLPNPDDGKVSLENTKVEGMCGFLSLAVSHPFIMKNEEAIEQSISFIKTGRFSSNKSEVHPCPAQPPSITR